MPTRFQLSRLLSSEFIIPAAVFIGMGCYLLLKYIGAGESIAMMLAIGIIGIGSYSLIIETVTSLRKKQFALDYIAILAIIVALLTGEYLAGMVIALMVATGHTLEVYGMNRAQRSLTQLIDRIPREVTVMQDQHEDRQVQLEVVQVGDKILVRKGEVLALDGILMSDHAQTDESSLTGEPYFLEKKQGDQLRSGIINIGEPFILRVTHAAKDSTYEKIIAMVKTAAGEKPPLVRLADRYSTWFTIVTLALAVLAYALSQDITRVLAVLVVATPCPLILATPIALMGGMNALAKHHVIVKKIASLEILARLHTMIFDKTGTITLGHPTITKIEVVSSDYTLSETLAIASAIERNSLHPLAKAIVAYAQQQEHVPLKQALAVHEQIGSGIIGRVDNQEYTLKKWTEIDGLAIGLFKEQTLVAVFHFDDKIKPGSKEVLVDLQRRGLELYIFTGDKRSTAERVVTELGQNIQVRAECTPEDKKNGIAELKAQGKTIAMVGDGINDAPALALADVGVVFSNEQQTAASEAADVVILNSEFELTATMLVVAKRTIQIAKQSIMWGIGLSLIAMIFAALGFITPVVGALLQEAIDLAVIVNALRASRQ